jgi:hypothetical protein
VHKGSTQTNKRSKVRVQKKEQKKPKKTLVWRTGLSGAPGPYDSELATFGFQKRRSAIIHRTVRCTSEATARKRNGRLQLSSTEATVRGQFAQKSEQLLEAHRTVNSICLVRHRTVRCHKKTKLQWSKPLEP